MAEYKGVLVCGELADGKLASITTELLGCGRKLADELKEDLSCLLASDAVGEASKEAIAFGADKVYVVELPLSKSTRLIPICKSPKNRPRMFPLG